MIPNQFVQDLLARTDIVEIVGAHVQLRKAGANLQGLCPFHNEKSPSFTVSASKQFYHCFGCGAHGTALGFLMEYSGYPFPEAVEELARKVGMTVPQETRFNALSPEQAVAQADARSQLLDLHVQACNFYKTQLKSNPRAIDYLKRRGLSGEIAAKFGLGYAPDEWQGLAKVAKQYAASTWVEAGLVIDKSDEHSMTDKRYDRFRDRVMFPIRNVKGEIIGFGGRIIDQGEPKYLNSPETPLFNKGQELYGLYEARVAIRNAGYALVTEGYMDVVALAQLGFAQVVATLGTAVGAAHVSKLFKYTDHIVFSFDGDKAGRKAAWRALEESLAIVTDTRRASFLFLPAEHDPDSFIRTQGTQAFEQAVRTAVPLSVFFVKELANRHDVSTAEGRASFLNDAKPMLLAIQAPVLRAQLTKSLANVAQLPPAELEFLLGVGRVKPSTHNALQKFTGERKLTLDGKPAANFTLGKRSNATDWQSAMRDKKAGIVRSTGALAPQAGKAALLALTLMQAPEQYLKAKPWLDAWREDLGNPRHDDLSLVLLLDGLQTLLDMGGGLNAARVSAWILSQVEQGQGYSDALSEWLTRSMSEPIEPAADDAEKLALALLEPQLSQSCQVAAVKAGQSVEDMERFKQISQELAHVRELLKKPSPFVGTQSNMHKHT